MYNPAEEVGLASRRKGLNMDNSFHVPVDRAYTDLLGRAVHNFSYLEQVVIHTIDVLNPGYFTKYVNDLRGFSSNKVAKDFDAEVTVHTNLKPCLKLRLKNCATHFTKLADDRNRLLHAHPYTAEGGRQQLNYRGRLPSVACLLSDVEATAHQFDDAAYEMNQAFDELRTFLYQTP